MPYLHGAEFIEVDTTAGAVRTAATGVIGLVGIAPIGDANEPTVIRNKRQAEEVFGKQLPGFTIPQALAQIFDQGAAGPVIVVNVFDADDNTAEVAAEVLTVTASKCKLAFAPIGGTITLTNSGATVTYVAGTDYTVDAFGNIRILQTIAEGASLRATYDKLDASTVTASIVVGADTNGVYTGMQCLLTAQSVLGITPKIIVAPTYCELATVAAAMITICDTLKAVCFIDGPDAQPDVSDVVAERGLAGTWAGFRSLSQRVMLLWPYVKRYDVATDATVLTPQSPYWAGVLSARDNDPAFGYWFSPSNVVLNGVLGLEFPVSANLSDPSSDTNTVNAAGISTVFSGFGTGFRTWGNRTAAYPSSTSAMAFLPVRRVADVIDASVTQAMLAYIDRPINNALIDAIRQRVNTFLNSLKQRGALIDGTCTFVSEDNPPEQIADGQLVFQIDFMPPTPAERITFKSILNVALLNTLIEA